MERDLTDLDRYVCRFVRIVEKYTDYVIVSGYISILLGLPRPTFDVDVLAKPMSREDFEKMLDELRANGFVTIEDKEKAFILFSQGHTISIHTPDVWYFDFKQPKDRWGYVSISSPLIARIGECEIRIAPPEVQIPYKLWLGSDKDIKDAVYIYERLKEIIDEERLREYAEAMGVDLGVLR